jgi:two-component sensor histidine kinase
MIEGPSPDGVGITDEQGRFEGVVTKDALLGARLVESKAKAVEMDGRHGELERLVAERTDALRAAVVQLEREIAERKLAQARIEQTLREKETLIEELFHRTRNTLQMIMGLVALQAEANPESGALARAAARTTARTTARIQAIARVHQCLYQSGDLSRVSARECLHGISRELLQSASVAGDAPEVHLDIEDQRFLIDTVVPLGVVFSELLANALQHAFPAGRAGNIRVSLKRQGAASSVLTFSDDGVGVPGNFDAWNQPALGLRLVQSIGVTQLGGKVEVSNIGGLSFRLEFPHPVAPARV